MTMFIHFFCLYPLGPTIKLNFNISKVAHCVAWLYSILLFSTNMNDLDGGCQAIYYVCFAFFDI